MCEFGVPEDKAKETVALIGDSHAGVYRIPLDTVAKAHGWRGLRFGHSSCPLSAAPRDLPGPERAHCTRWRAAVVQWLTAASRRPHRVRLPARGGRGVVTRQGQDQFATADAGLRRRLGGCPRRSRACMVIRDNPSVDLDTNACVEKAMNRAQAGRAAPARCRAARRSTPTRPRRRRKRLGGRVSLLDLTPFFCDAGSATR